MIPVHLLIFDLDGTLVNTLEDITASVNFTLTKLGRKPVPMEKVRGFVGDGVTMLLSRALGDRQEFIEDARGIYTLHHRRNLALRSRLYPGVQEILQHFRTIPLAVVSNKSTDLIRPLLEHLQVFDRFARIVGAGGDMPLKPAPDALVRTMAEFGAAPEQTVMVGDGTTDIEAGKAAGCITCAVTYGFRSRQQLAEAGPDHFANECRELKNIFIPAAQ